MSVFRSIVFSAVLAGIAVGITITAVQSIGTIPLIQQAETYEKALGATHGHFMSEAVALESAAPAAANSHHAAEWEPADGFQRTSFTLGANILTAIGFSLLLGGAFTLRRHSVSWRDGMIWGLGGFVVFTVAPGLGLPPELPGMPVAELAARQLWWFSTAAATAAGICLLVFKRQPWAAGLGLALIVIPHLIGAPVVAAAHTDVPAALSHRFVVAVTLTSLVFWVLLGVSTSVAVRRLSNGP
ncbi:CbtA family protein [Rhodopseudomonas pseudopalustris]|uniref:Cobalt transporter subunit CbtA n=1 Tax=Rhodopseudomonas pseudopalustris TaxID=1513892 RepID=A0A1H8LU85_9BRAD|nr:CbtA family protein [Rhodopseudomonas pseudopalustris]SEO08665.1 cobalt transporter subunit CbtA [Rhodopseudomonas pseudopalustris]